MMQRIVITVFLFLFFFSTFSIFSQSKQEVDDLRIIVTLLDYVAKDYSVAVANGEIINEAEYEEQIDFVERTASLHHELTPVLDNAKFTALKSDIDSLVIAIDQVVAPAVISKLSLQIKNAILDLGVLKISPTKWPSIKNGRILYEQNCSSCHGPKGFGDGPQGKTLDPRPSSFRDDDGMEVLSPLQAYNVIKLGVEGTGMASYDQILKENELWDLAFYVMAIRHENETESAKIPTGITLDSITKWSDGDLRNELTKHQGVSMADIRTYEPVQPDPLDVSLAELDKSYTSYKAGDSKMAISHALKSYLEGVELVESLLPSHIVRPLERNMVDYRKAIKNRNDKKVDELYDTLTDDINSAKSYLSEIDYSFAFIFGASLSILLREALEALLIILIILSVLKPLKIKNAIKAVHVGWISAVVLGFVSWVFVDKLVSLSGASREVLEGVGSIIAVLVLLYAGTWLHSHSEVSKWTAFVKEKVNKVSESGSWMGLALFSFIVVFREAFEVVLFLSSLNINSTEESSTALIWALISATLIIVVLAYFFLKTTKKLPLEKIFKFSAIVISILAIVLAGKGIKALQEAGFVSVSPLDFIPQIDVLGLYPNLEAVATQMTVLIIILLLNRRNRGKAAVNKLVK